MQSIIFHDKVKKTLYILAGIAGISLIILIHEAGHFLFAQYFNVATPVFSIGFGPTLFEIPCKKTMLKIALFPLGGYVEMDPDMLAEQSYIRKMLILFGGILFNFIFAYGVLVFYTIRNKLSPSSNVSSSQTMKQAFVTIFTQQNGNSTFIGPIGIISTIGQSLAINSQLYWFALAIISFNIGFLNMIPLPFFDGGKALLLTIETLIGKNISMHIVWIISMTFLALFILFITQITLNDVKRLWKK